MDLVILALALLIALPAAARACTTVVIGREASPTGHVIVGHNEDDGGRLVNRHGYVPAADHAPGETLPAEDGYALIPQAAHTHGFYWSEMKGASGGMSTADSFYNDQGVLIVSDSCVDSKEDLEDASRLSEGGIGFNLRRVMAERANSARHAVEVGVEMLERYGYVSSGRTYTCADADEAWMLQVVSGRRYAARRVGDREAAFIPNYYTIHEIDFDDRDNFIVSPDLVEYARKKGWYDPAQGAFDFARVYQAEKDWMGPGNTYRSAAGYSILTRSPFWREDRYPFAVVPKRPVAVEQVMEILRCYYEGSFLDPAWARMQFPGGAPHDTEIRRICTGTTMESSVTVFGDRDRPETTTMWLCAGRPSELPYLPFHPFCGVPAALDTMGDEAPALLAVHCRPDAEIATWRDNGWQKLRDFQNLFELVFQQHHDEHERWLWSYENGLARRESELQARVAALDDRERAAALLRERDAAVATEALAAIGEQEKNLRPVAVSASPAATAMDSAEEIEFSFALTDGRIPSEDALLLTLGGTNARLMGIRPVAGSLRAEEGRWTVRVKAADLQKAGVPGTFDYWLGGRDQWGRSFGGRCFFTFTERTA